MYNRIKQFFYPKTIQYYDPIQDKYIQIPYNACFEDATNSQDLLLQNISLIKRGKIIHRLFNQPARVMRWDHVETSEKLETCILCCDNLADVRFSPCNHQYCCQKCVVKLICSWSHPTFLPCCSICKAQLDILTIVNNSH